MTTLRRTYILNQSLVTSNPFSINVPQSFAPTHVIIRQILYANIAGVDTGTYLIWSSINNDYCGATYVGFQGAPTTPETVLQLSCAQQTIMFRVERANSGFDQPSGQLTMVLEFIKE